MNTLHNSHWFEGTDDIDDTHFVIITLRYEQIL